MMLLSLVFQLARIPLGKPECATKRGKHDDDLYSEVHNGSDDLLPVGTEGEASAVNRAVLAGAIESKNVVSALNAGACPLAVKLLRRAVEAGMHDKEWALLIRLIDAMEVAGKGGVLVGDFYGQNRRIAKGAA